MSHRLFLKIKPALAIVLTIAILAPILILPKKTHAIPVTIVGGWLPQLDVIIGTTGTETNQSLFEWAQTFVREALRKRILDLMVDEIIQWVQGGDDPKFVTDWQQFLTDAGNVALGDLAVQVAGAGICQPFRISILDNLRVPEKPTSNSLYGSSITCTLDDIVDNIESFYNDFQNGGWEAYIESLKVQNDPVALFVITQNAKFQTIASAQEAAKNEALAGGGFLSTKTCDESPTSQSTDIDKDGIKGDIASTCKITTPGSTIGSLVAEAVGADIKYILEADQLAAYVAAISDALINRLIREGVGGLQGLATDNAPDAGYIPTGSDGCGAFQFGSSLREACEGYQSTNGQNFELTNKNLVTEIQAVSNKLISFQNALTRLKAVADELETFIASESIDRSATCITQALNPYFTPPTLEEISKMTDEIDARVLTINEQIAELESYKRDLQNFVVEDWARFTVLASTIRSRLAVLTIDESKKDEIDSQRNELQEDFSNIKQDVMLCR